MQHPIVVAMGMLQFALAGGCITMWLLLWRERLLTSLVPYERRLQVPWWGADVIVLVAAVLFIETAAQLVVERSSTDAPRALSAASLVMHAVGRLVWLAFAIAYLVSKTGAYADDLGFDARKLGYDVRLGAGAFLAAIVPVYGIQIVLTQVAKFKSEHPLVKVTSDHGSLGMLLLVTVLAAVIAPLVEEFMFRVVLQGWLEKKQVERRERLGLPGEPAGWTPIAMASAVFALLHVSNGPDWVALFVLSLFMGYVYQRTHRIFPSLVMHGLVNGLAMAELWVRFFAGTK